MKILFTDDYLYLNPKEIELQILPPIGSCVELYSIFEKSDVDEYLYLRGNDKEYHEVINITLRFNKNIGEYYYIVHLIEETE